MEYEMNYRTRRLIRWCKSFSWKVKYLSEREAYKDLSSKYAKLEYDHEALMKICKMLQDDCIIDRPPNRPNEKMNHLRRA
jgi:hypothetical protein